MTKDGTYERQIAKLRKDLGEVFLTALEDSETVEIVLNADGTLWQERLGEPLEPIGTMSASCADAAMRTIAAYHHATLTRADPSIECELPLDGSRFAGQIPPIVTAPVFAVRKRASRVFTLQQYVEAGIMTPQQKKFLCDAIRDHRNLLAIGATGGGKTTLLNALILPLTDQFPNERLVIIEDTAEIQCAAKDLCPISHQSRTGHDPTCAYGTSDATRQDSCRGGEGTGSLGPAHELEHRARRWNRNTARKQCRGWPDQALDAREYAPERSRERSNPDRRSGRRRRPYRTHGQGPRRP